MWHGGAAGMVVVEWYSGVVVQLGLVGAVFLYAAVLTGHSKTEQEKVKQYSIVLISYHCLLQCLK